MAKSIDELPLPIISPDLPKAVRTKAQLIFYKHLVRVAAWGLRGMYSLYIDQDGRTEEHDAHDKEVWEDLLFQFRYQALLKMSGALPFFRWPNYLREFVFYNSVGVHPVPFGEGASDPNAGFEIEEGHDNLGKFVQVRIYSQLSTESWKNMKQAVDKQLRAYEHKWERKGTSLELIVQAANLHRTEPALTYRDIGAQLPTRFPELATKKNGYTESDVKKIMGNARTLDF